MRTIFSLAAGLAAATSIATAQQSSTGNGAPSGSHYNLNIIGVSHDKSANPDFASGNVIFVGLGSKTTTVSTKILLSQTATGVFEVLDKNGTDGQASFGLPAPGTYTIWARALGKPGGQARITTCATDIVLNDPGDICSTMNEVFVRGTGKSKFTNVTTNLTTIILPAPVTAADSALVTLCGGTNVSLFNTCLLGYFWQYDNNGLKLLQIRFYPNPS